MKKLVYSIIHRNEIQIMYGETPEVIQSELSCIYNGTDKVQGHHMCDCDQKGNFGCQGKAVICECQCHTMVR